MKPVWLFLGRLTFLLFRPLKGIVFKHPYFQAPRVRVALKAPDGEVLVVRTWLGLQRWSLPGGGIDKGESEKDAAVREVHEETGVQIRAEDLVFLGEVQMDEAPHVTLKIYEAQVASKQLPKLSLFHRLEITDRRWWSGGVSENTGSSLQWYLDRTSRENLR